MIYLRWLKHRLIFFRRVIISLYDGLIYQKKSQFLLHKYNAHRCPFEVILFYNTFGRVFFALKEILALITKDKIFKKSITIDGLDKKIDYKKIYQKGGDGYLYPKSPMVNSDKVLINDEFYKKISQSFILAYRHDNDKDITNEWERISGDFRDIFFDKSGNIKKENLENFRFDPNIYNKIFNNQYRYIERDESYSKNYLFAIDLVLEYHRYAEKIDKEILASISESQAGNHLSVNYRGKKLSEQLLQNLVVANDIKNVPLSLERRNILLDIGVSFGGTNRIINYYHPNSTQILIDLPETLILTAYYIKYNFPNKKIALLDDIYPYLDNFDNIIEKYDFIIVPPFILDYIKGKSIDLVMNSTSLSFISKEYLNYYLKETDRVLKDGGYFYS